MINLRKKISLLILISTSLLAVTGCEDHKPPFSMTAFEAAKQECGAADAYVIDTAPNTVGFRGTKAEHLEQAGCIKAKLAGTDIRTVVLGSQLHDR